jgi:hypothetical protein
VAVGDDLTDVHADEYFLHSHDHRSRLVAVCVVLGLSTIAATAAIIVVVPGTRLASDFYCQPTWTFCFGHPMESTSPSGSHTYAFTVDRASGGMNWGELGFSVVTPSGGTITPTSSGWNATVLSATGLPVVNYSFAIPTSGWSNGGWEQVGVNQSLVLTSPAEFPLAGDGLEAYSSVLAGGTETFGM